MIFGKLFPGLRPKPMPEPQYTDVRQWRCFHCDEVFTTHEGAAEHFGETICSEPLCLTAATADKKEVLLDNIRLARANDRLRDKVEALEFLIAGNRDQFKAFGPNVLCAHDAYVAYEEASFRLKMANATFAEIAKERPDLLARARAAAASEPENVDMYT